jgi:hypothetical protein
MGKSADRKVLKRIVKEKSPYKPRFVIAGKVMTKNEYLEYLTQLATMDKYDERTNIKAMEMIGKFCDNGWLTENIDLKDDRTKMAEAIINEVSRRKNG